MGAFPVVLLINLVNEIAALLREQSIFAKRTIN
jgi:hypothetical protein